MTTIILLDYLRHEYTQRVKDVNLNNAGAEFNLIEVDIKGVSAAINEGLLKCDGDAFTMANDILMPSNWLADMLAARDRIPNTGLVGIHTVEGMPSISINGVYDILCPFGNVFITKELMNQIGFYNTDLDPYSTNDADYAIRSNMVGFRNYYIEGKAEHLGLDVGQVSDYRAMKDEGLANGNGQQWIDYYQKSGNLYLGYEQENRD